jgi:hypothetical protein
VTSNGVFRPFAMVKGKAVATWTLRCGTVALTPLQKIGAADQAKLDAEAANIVDYLASTPVVAEPMSAS